MSCCMLGLCMHLSGASAERAWENVVLASASAEGVKAWMLRAG